MGSRRWEVTGGTGQPTASLGVEVTAVEEVTVGIGEVPGAAVTTGTHYVQL